MQIHTHPQTPEELKMLCKISPNKTEAMLADRETCLF